MAQSNGPGAPAIAKAARPPAAFRLAPASAASARLRLAAPEAAAIDTLRQANRRPVAKRLEIGIGRDIDVADSAALAAARWTPTADGRAAHWEVTSAEAQALRLALRVERMDAGVELRFAGNARPDLVYGPFTAADVAAAGAAYWSPVLEGDTAIVEVFVAGAAADPAITLAQVSHLFVDPADPKADAIAKAAGTCEVNFICRASTDAALLQAGRAVAKMAFTTTSGGTALCTGTLLNALDGSFTPYFLSAAHCISTPAEASTLTTYWQYETATCLGTTPGPGMIQVSGGAALLYANEDSDFGFMRLNTTPPSSAVYAGWDAATVTRGAAVTAVHHPDVEVEEGRTGTIAGFDAPLAAGAFTRVQWNSTATGVVEPGSSGSALLTGNSSAGYKVRGGLLGGLSSCTAPVAELNDHYSRLDLAYPYIAQHLNPSGAPALGPNVTANPGFESGAGGWTQSSTTGAAIIVDDPAVARSGSWYAWLGGDPDVTETISQPLIVPQGPARLQFWYRIATGETTTSQAYDKLTIALVSLSNGSTIKTLGTLSNLDATSTWVQSPVYDVSAAGGQAVQLQFRAVNDLSLPTSFRIDDVTLTTTLAVASANTTALWWNAAESGWGLNVNNQGNVTFATLFTYDSAGAPMWLVMPSGQRQNGAETYTGALYRTTGSPFNASPFPPITAANITEVGAMTLDFSSPGATLAYTVNDTYVSKAIQKQVLVTRPGDCQSTTASRAGATNYQDLWWNSAESGWGLNLTQEGSTIFATLFTYAANNQGTSNPGLWLVMPQGTRQSDGSYSGDLYSTTGPAFNAQPWPGINFAKVGTMRLRFGNGESGTLDYTVNGLSVTKAITRQVFSSPVPLCNG